MGEEGVDMAARFGVMSGILGSQPRALTPLSFLNAHAQVYPDRIAVVHGDLRRTWRET
jgi:hypothetical protein